MQLENKNAIIYGTGRSNGGAVVRTLANFASGMFPSYITNASTATQLQRKAA